MQFARILVLISLAAAASAAPDFTKDIRPILQKRCWGCHGAAVQTNGLRLDDGPAALKGGYSGPAIIPGDPAASRLLARASSKEQGVRMPPNGPAPTDAELALLREWIAAGAEFPASAKAAATAKPKHWSFQPVAKPALPEVRQAGWVRNEIDRFVLARLDREGWAPSPEADKETLLRRVTLDLTGLPPTPTEITAFLTDRDGAAYERAVDRLLASPHYGERWARQWLDLAHYADSDGYEKDLARPWAWRWRNWVINALNADMPFDRFTIEQLAGDLLPNATVEQRVATGFLRNTLTNREAGTDREEARFEQLVDRANTTGTVWLGLAVGCAQCHDHKYDPITQRDYYQLFAFYDKSDETSIDAPLRGEAEPYQRMLPEYEQARKLLLDAYEIPTLLREAEVHWRTALEKPGTTPEWDFALTSMRAMLDGAAEILRTPEHERDPRDQRRLVDYFVERTPPAVGMDKAKLDRVKELRPVLDRLTGQLPRYTQTRVMRQRKDAPPSAIRIRGQWNQKGIAVDPAPPAFLAAGFSSKDATRLDLARWLVARDNPLTARVTVNRAWQALFGQGLVRTSEDFGVKGEAPSHPQLLDWLAAEFMDQGWSLKKLHKTIVMSAAYRQSSKTREGIQEKDPENALLARQSRIRLPAEQVRDVALAASGLLHRRIGGPSIRPPQPAGVAELGYGNSNKWTTDAAPDRYRRGLYIHFQRTTPYPMLMTFDAPDSNTACSRRSRSNTPLQALNLLNDEVFHEAAQALGQRIEKEAPASLSGRIRHAFALTVGRAPTEKEQQRMAAFHDEQARILAAEKAEGVSAWTGVSRVLLNLDEFITRE